MKFKIKEQRNQATNFELWLEIIKLEFKLKIVEEELTLIIITKEIVLTKI